MRKGYVTMIGGTLLFAVALGGVTSIMSPSRPVSPVSVKDAARAASGSASQQAAALEAAEIEARENPPPPLSQGVVANAPAPVQPSAPSGYGGTAPKPSIVFDDGTAEVNEGETPPPEPVSTEE